MIALSADKVKIFLFFLSLLDIVAFLYLIINVQQPVIDCRWLPNLYLFAGRICEKASSVDKWSRAYK